MEYIRHKSCLKFVYNHVANNMKKKHFGILLILMISFVSCNEKKITELNERISLLETQNKKLTDSITKSEYHKVENSSIIGMTSKPSFHLGEKSQVRFVFTYPEKIMSYNVYTSTVEGEIDELIFKNLTDNHFEYDFIPNEIGEEQIQLITVFKMNDSVNTEYHIPTNFFVTITE